MTTAKENEILTQVGPGTPLGGLMREYWLPAAKSSELVADGDPMRLRLLGENLIAFRDTSGKVGVMDHRCPHRCASLFFGRNEEGGIRCVYHGWKFDTDGNCLDMANVPPHQDFKHKVHAKAYKSEERNGLIWVFMGDQENVPALPDIEATRVPEDDMTINFQMRECNWLQAVEGELDTSHVGFLHFGHIGADTFKSDMNRYTVENRAPEYVTTDTDYGFMYGAHREAEAGKTYWRLAHFLFPCFTMPPLGPLEINVAVRCYVPIDDENTMIIVMLAKSARSPERAKLREKNAGATDFNYLPNTTDWNGRWRLQANRDNDYLIDREAQRTESYTGIGGIILQDQAVTESMDPVVDRTFEHLAPSDIAITQNRRRIIAAARAFAKDGTLPPSAQKPDIFSRVRGGAFIAADETDWQDAYNEHMDAHAYQPPKVQAAE